MWRVAAQAESRVFEGGAVEGGLLSRAHLPGWGTSLTVRIARHRREKRAEGRSPVRDRNKECGRPGITGTRNQQKPNAGNGRS